MNKREEPDGRSRVVQRQDKIEYCEAPRDSPADKVVSSSKILLDDFFFLFLFFTLCSSLSLSFYVYYCKSLAYETEKDQENRTRSEQCLLGTMCMASNKLSEKERLGAS